MVRIVVFDSGLGSLSIIYAIRRLCKAEIIYFADTENYPYGEKSQAQLDSVIKHTLEKLQSRFSPDLIVMASNTPSLVLHISDPKIIDVKPPLIKAKKISKSKHIGILATKSTIESKGLSNFIKSLNFPKSFKFFKINASNLINLVEDGKFFTNENYCKKIIRKELSKLILKNNIDVITLSSTHLPFLKSFLEKEFPNVQFIEPGDIVAQKVYKKIKNSQSKRNSLKIFTSGNPTIFHKKLLNLKIKNQVKSF